MLHRGIKSIVSCRTVVRAVNGPVGGAVVVGGARCFSAQKKNESQTFDFSKKNEGKSTNIVWSDGLVNTEERAKLTGLRGGTIWITGLSGSGKSTIACALEKQLLMKKRHTYRLDGDNVRFGLNKDLGFSAKDRDENIRRIGEVAKLFSDSGSLCITAFISPFRAARDLARKVHEDAKLPFIEVHTDVPITVAEERDPKGLYKKFREGKFKDLTGKDSPYEAPLKPELIIKTHEKDLDKCVQQILDYLKSRKLVN
jgi:adenylylsulfate kinase